MRLTFYLNFSLQPAADRGIRIDSQERVLERVWVSLPEFGDVCEQRLVSSSHPKAAVWLSVQIAL